jgi:uncharacterized glyoxalase superfamily protein PhnB
MADMRTVLFTPRYQEALAFYGGLLGGEPVTSWDDETGRGTVLRMAGGDACVELIEQLDGPGPSGVMLALQVVDVDAVHADLVHKGVDITAPLADQPWGHRNLGLTDPHGLQVALFTPLAGHSE